MKEPYKKLGVVPSTEELSAQHDRAPLLKPNVIDGPYDSLEHYLDLHYSLLRHDFVEFFRGGIEKYRDSQTIDDIFVYKWNRFAGLDDFGRPVITLDSSYSDLDFETEKRLIFGNLLFLYREATSETAVVKVADSKDLKETLQIQIALVGTDDEVKNALRLLIRPASFVILEAATTFIAYEAVLLALQRKNAINFPFMDQLVLLQPPTLPGYLVDESVVVDLGPLLVDPRLPPRCEQGTVLYENLSLLPPDKRYYRPKRAFNASSADCHMNDSQRAAIQLALTSSVALIQGPPGTGKSYLGLKLVETLLHNFRLRSPRPLLIVCYTNHALDQFLELILERTDLKDGGIVRVGRQCKSEYLKACTLDVRRELMEEQGRHKWVEWLNANAGLTEEVRNVMRKLDDRAYSSARAGNYTAARDLSHFLEDLIADVTLEELREEIPVSIYEWFANTDTDPYMWVGSDWKRLYSHMKKIRSRSNSRNDGWETINEWDTDDRALENFHSRPAQHPIFPENQPPGFSGEEDVPEYDFISDTIDFSRLPRDLLQWTKVQRQTAWSLWLWRYRNRKLDELPTYWRPAKEAEEKLRDMSMLKDLAILARARVVGMTTTGAARNEKLLQKLGCEIMIVEEAAEVFECHAVAGLARTCEHLILVGDHLQLRPNPNLLYMCKEKKFDVSMFERLVMNKFPSVRLNIQHRMRPEIRRLLNVFYEDLQDHPSTKEWPPVRGLAKNLYFVDHQIQESDDQYFSKYNLFEAEFSIALANYLMKQEYSASQITLLTFYKAQQRLLEKLLLDAGISSAFGGVKAEVVDSYQGNENEIIILNLVRSNETKKLGFTSNPNRICVALSRARKGLYIIGNSSMFEHSSDWWEVIVKYLRTNDFIGMGLHLQCERHTQHTVFARSPVDFEKSANGGCQRICSKQLKCGHTCQLFCHGFDPEHNEIECKAQCPAFLACGHRCLSLCHFGIPHPLCIEQVQRVLGTCGHEIVTECYKKDHDIKCVELVKGTLPCKHESMGPCHLMRTRREAIKCQEPCTTILACGCACSGTCTTCHRGRFHKRCDKPCNRIRICGHECKRPCPKSCGSCVEMCKLGCAHRLCNRKCYEVCAECMAPCAMGCAHQKCSRECWMVCDIEPCLHLCTRKYPRCGHSCPGLCGDDCPPNCPICSKKCPKDQDYTRYSNALVYLPDCQHLVSAVMLDKSMAKFKDVGDFSHWPKCPQCGANISSSRRYAAILRKVFLAIQATKSVLRSGAPSQATLLQRINKLKVQLRFARNLVRTRRFTVETCHTYARVLDTLEHYPQRWHLDPVSSEFFQELVNILVQSNPLSLQQEKDIESGIR
eukprot:Gregarina_sp_Poly_1__1441@NODE_135_length_13154_cov_22_841446_g120_i0_p2_GENE_NODE_135_length_13154_cov_22_841446_g120_i0NODE_135_length_13154_cov_22_841446_g120_i0_p2_ORF_typecomplete_len1335_score149_45AAA_12/PF13087_6/3_3e51AAA_11/PF13086_6/1_9e44AAA_30/PF13604_6/3_2e09AAA_30/PF13604_6/0_017AAA_19/PF13245_6/1_1e11AAA_19/PF13245_6/4_5e03Viral_helicase1/PF01443_18/94Viral_helicase1/PF01443_18/4_3e10UvrDhelicase/PF00580_21/0_00026UvrDhelicase/PF00580_21/8e02DUF2075/PF09848_9/0_00042DUF2075/PF098